jgi:hypothetical protein
LRDEINNLRKKKNKVIHIDDLLKNIDLLTPRVKQMEKEMEIIRIQIKKYINLIENEQFDQIKLIDTIISNWEELVKIRELSKISTTNVKVVIQKKKIDKEKYLNFFEEEAENELREAEEENYWNYLQELKEYKNKGKSSHKNIPSYLLMGEPINPPTFEPIEKEEYRNKVINVSKHKIINY